MEKWPERPETSSHNAERTAAPMTVPLPLAAAERACTRCPGAYAALSEGRSGAHVQRKVVRPQLDRALWRRCLAAGRARPARRFT